MTLQEIILDFKNKNNYTCENIASLSGVSKGTVSRWLSGEIVSLKYETSNKLSSLIGIDINAHLKAENEKYYRPIIGTVKAGYNLDAEEIISSYEEVTKTDFDMGDFFLKVSGDSMSGSRIYDGDLVYVKRCDYVENNQTAVIIIGNEATIKKVVMKNDLLILVATNPDYETRYFTTKEVEELPVKIIGKVIYTKIIIN